MIQVIIAILVLSFLIFIHELGHFIVAKKSGVWVEEFGIGLPPKIWGKKIGDTLYSLNALPFGGFVRLHGEVGDVNITKPKLAFINKSKKVKVAVALAGIFMNFMFAWLAFSFLFSQSGIASGIRVIEVTPESTAEVAGILAEDKIISIDDVSTEYFDNFHMVVRRNLSKNVDVVVLREGKTIVLNASFPAEAPDDGGILGVVFTADNVENPSGLQTYQYFYHGARKTINWSQEIYYSLSTLIKQLTSGGGLSGVGGPVEVVAIGAETAKYGFMPLLEFAAIISVNLGLLNLVPFPPLDGSRVLFVSIEGITGKKLKPKYEEYLYMFGMAILLGFIILVTLNNLPKLFSSSSITEFVEAVMQ